MVGLLGWRLLDVARPERFELPTSWFVAMRSIQLSYGRTDMKLQAPEGRRLDPQLTESSWVSPWFSPDILPGVTAAGGGCQPHRPTRGAHPTTAPPVTKAQYAAG